MIPHHHQLLWKDGRRGSLKQQIGECNHHGSLLPANLTIDVKEVQSATQECLKRQNKNWSRVKLFPEELNHTI